MGCPDHGFHWVRTTVTAGYIQLYSQLGHSVEFDHGMPRIIVSIRTTGSAEDVQWYSQLGRSGEFDHGMPRSWFPLAMFRGIPSWVVPVNLIMGCPGHDFRWVCTTGSSEYVQQYSQLGRSGEFDLRSGRSAMRCIPIEIIVFNAILRHCLAVSASKTIPRWVDQRIRIWALFLFRSFHYS